MPNTTDVEQLIDSITGTIEAHGTPDTESEDTPIRAIVTDQSPPGTPRPHFRRDEPSGNEWAAFFADAAMQMPTDNVYTSHNGERYVFPTAAAQAQLSFAKAGIPPKYHKPLRRFAPDQIRIDMSDTPSRREHKDWRDTLLPRPNHRIAIPPPIVEMMIDAIHLARPQCFWTRNGEDVRIKPIDIEGYELAEVDWDKDRHKVRGLIWDEIDEPNWNEIYSPHILGYIDFLRFCMVRPTEEELRERQDPRLIDMHPTISVLIHMRNCIRDLGVEMSPDLQRRILSTLDYLRERYCPLLQWRD